MEETAKKKVYKWWAVIQTVISSVLAALGIIN